MQSDSRAMTSSRPYMIRALFEWISDNEFTPYLLVNAEAEGVHVPVQYVRDGRILLNISMAAVNDLHLGNDCVTFGARFGGVATEVYLPVDAIMAIYARENGQGMMFNNESGPSTPAPAKTDKPEPKRPTLKVVK